MADKISLIIHSGNSLSLQRKEIIKKSFNVLEGFERIIISDQPLDIGPQLSFNKVLEDIRNSEFGPRFKEIEFFVDVMRPYRYPIEVARSDFIRMYYGWLYPKLFYFDTDVEILSTPPLGEVPQFACFNEKIMDICLFWSGSSSERSSIFKGMLDSDAPITFWLFSRQVNFLSLLPIEKKYFTHHRVQ